MLCCIIALTCIISCSSSHHTSGHYHNVHSYHGPNGQEFHGDSLELLALEAIIIGAILIVPPVLEAIGKAIDEILVELGLKKNGPTF
jgi:hypothetical protein